MQKIPYKYVRPVWCVPRCERDREIDFLMHSFHNLYNDSKNNLKPSLLDIGFAGSGYIQIILDFGMDFTGLDGDAGRINGRSLLISIEDKTKWQNNLSKIKYIHADIVDYTSEILYDIVMSISAIEHIVPIEYDYHHDFDFYRDIKAIESMKKLVKKNGHLLLTFPCGLERILCPDDSKIPESLKYKFIQSRHHIMVYDENRIEKVINNWEIINEEYWISPHLGNTQGSYEKSSKQKALNFDHKPKSGGILSQALCCLLLKEPS